MSRTSTLILLGVLVIVVPFSGLPVAICAFLSVVFGACVAIIGLMIRASEASRSRASVEAALSPAASDTVPIEPEEPSTTPAEMSAI